MSSAEAELYGMEKAPVDAMGFQSLLNDLGVKTEIVLHGGSSAAMAMAGRSGIGKTKHVQIKYFWLQDAVKEKRVRLERVPGLVDPADVLTKPHSIRRMEGVASQLNGQIKKKWSTEPKTREVGRRHGQRQR